MNKINQYMTFNPDSEYASLVKKYSPCKEGDGLAALVT